jgi:hypothetical protein
MGQKIQGNLSVLNVADARRLNQGLNAETISAQKELLANAQHWQALSAASGQDVVLPDASTLPNGWRVIIQAAGAGALAVKTHHATTPVLLKSIAAGDAWEFVLTDNGTAAGAWYSNKLEESSAGLRYTSSFDATTSWGSASGGYYTFTVTVATHGLGTAPAVAVQEVSGADYVSILPDQVKTAANGDVSIRVPETPDGRFAGRLVIS